MARAPESEDLVDIPEVPQIDGLALRRFRGEEDYPLIADVMQRSRDADDFDAVDTVEDIACEFAHLMNCDPKQDMLFAEVDGLTISFSRVQWLSRYGDVRTYEHFVYMIPECRRSGLRRAMMLQNERRILQIAAGHPKGHAKYFETRATCSENDWRLLIESEGYRPHIYNILMLRPLDNDIPDLELPDGISERAVRADDYMAIWRVAEEALREERNLITEYWDKEGFERFAGSHFFQPDTWRIAWHGDDVVGGVFNFVDAGENKRYGRNWGYIGALFVDRARRGQGVASALIASSLRDFKKAGLSEGALMVDSENPSGAVRLYEKLGFHVQRRYALYRKPIE